MFFLLSFSSSFDICLDIGSYFTKSSTFTAGEAPKIGMNYQSKRLTPSFLAFRVNSSLYQTPHDKITKQLIKNIKLEFGDDALGVISTHPKLGSGFFTKYIDRNNKVSSEIAEELLTQSTVFQLSPHTLLSLYLKLYLDCIANDRIVRNVHVVFPASFTLPQRDAVKTAISMAGYILGESCDDADALIHAYASSKFNRNQPPKKVLFIDVGATTTKAFVVRFETVEGSVKARRYQYSIDEKAGGMYLTVAISEEITQKIKNPTEVDKQHALEVAENIKKQLTLLETVEQTFETESGDQINITMTRSDLEELGQNFMHQVEEVINGAIAGHVIDDVEVVGGSSRIPFVQEIIRVATNYKIKHSLNADEAVAIGGSYAAQLAKQINTYDLPEISAEYSHYSLKLRTIDGDMPFCNRHDKCSEKLPFPGYAAGFIFSYFEEELPEGLETREYTYIVTHPEGNNIIVFLSLAPPGISGTVSCHPEDGRCQNGTIRYVPRQYNNSKVITEFSKQMSEHNRKARLSNELESLAIEFAAQMETNATFRSYIHPNIKEDMERTVADTKKWLFENTKVNTSELKVKYVALKNLTDNVYAVMKRYRRIGSAMDRAMAAFQNVSASRQALEDVPEMAKDYEAFDKYLQEVKGYLDHVQILYRFLPKYNNGQIKLEELEMLDKQLNEQYSALYAKYSNDRFEL